MIRRWTKRTAVLAVCLITSVVVATGVSAELVEEITGDTWNVVLSNRDVNRFVCASGLMGEPIFSEEKGIIGHVVKDSAFIKFLILKTGDTEQFVTARAEFFLLCDGAYTKVLATPQDIPSKTFRIGGSTARRIEKNRAVYSGRDPESVGRELTERVFAGDYLSGYSITKQAGNWLTITMESALTGKPYTLEAMHVRTINVEGTGLGAREYVLRGRGRLEMSEMDFAVPDFGSDTFGITVEPKVLIPGREGRLVIISRGAAR